MAGSGVDTSMYNRPPPQSPVGVASDITGLMNQMQQNRLLQSQTSLSNLSLAKERLTGLADLLTSVEMLPDHEQPKGIADAVKQAVELYGVKPEEAAMVVGDFPANPKDRRPWYAQQRALMQSAQEELDTIRAIIEQNVGGALVRSEFNRNTGATTPLSATPLGLPPGEAAERGVFGRQGIGLPMDIRPGANPMLAPGGPAGGGMPGMGAPEEALTPPPAPGAPPAPPAAPQAAAEAEGPQLPPELANKAPRTVPMTGVELEQAKSEIPLGNTLQATAAGSPDRRGMLANMKSALDAGEGFESGPLAEYIGTLKTGANQLAGMAGLEEWKPFDQSPITNQEEFRKFALQLAQQQAGALGGTDQRERTAMGANPSEYLSSLGNDRIINILMGNEDAIILKDQLWQKAKVRGNISMGEFNAAWNKIFDPRIFQLQYLTGKERSDLFKTMPAAEQKRFVSKLRAMKDLGWVAPNRGD